MFRKLVQALSILAVMAGMLFTTAPAYAAPSAAAKRNLKGTIVALDSKARTITVAPLKGANVKIRVAKGTILSRKGKPSSFSKFHVGDKVNLKYDAKTKQASKIEDAPGLYEIHGTVESVDVTAGTLTVASEEGGNSVTLNVDASTSIWRNGASATLADLLVGDKVEAKYNSATMLASSIKTEVEDSDLLGTVAAIDTAAKTVTIAPEDGSADVTLNISESTVFISHDTVISFGDLAIGDFVEAEYDSSTMIASKIEIEDSSPNSDN